MSNITQPYTDATGTTHADAYFVPTNASINFLNEVVTLNYQVFHNQEAFELGLQPVSLSARPDRRPGQQGQVQIEAATRAQFSAKDHPELVESIKTAILDCCTAPAATKFEAQAAETGSKLAEMRAARK